MPERETKTTDKRDEPVAEASPRQLYIKPEEDSLERIQIPLEPSEDEFEELTPKYKSPIKKDKTHDGIYPEGDEKSLKTTPTRKMEQPEEKDYDQGRKKAGLKHTKKPKEVQSAESDETPAAAPTVRRLSRWVQRVFKPSRSTRDEEAGGERGSPQESSTLSTRSSQDVDKTFTSRRRRLLTFLSPSRRKERKRARIKAKKDLAPPVEVVVSESDYSLELPAFPRVDPADLRSRIVTTGDCKKIDDMLLKRGWDRSFYASRGIQTMGERRESLLQHIPEERRKVDAIKMADSQGQMMGVLSKVVSSPSLIHVVDQSLQRAEFSSLHPRAMSPFDLRASMKKRIIP